MKTFFYTHGLFILSLTSGCVESGIQDEKKNQVSRRGSNLLGVLTHQMFDPVDPMKYMLSGVNNQYSQDYNYGTNNFDPNRFTFMFNGGRASESGRSFIPSFSNTGMFQNSPNYQKANPGDETSRPTANPTTISNPELGSNADKKHLFGNVEIATPTLSVSHAVPTKPAILEPEIMPPLMVEQIPEGILQHVNVTNMFLKSPYRGQPGMLGVGAQIPMPPPQMLSNFTVAKQEHVPKPVLEGYPETFRTIGETGVQSNNTNTFLSNYDTSGVLKQDLSMYQNIKPLQNFDIPNPFDVGMANEGDHNETDIAYENQNTFSVIKPITNGYDWHGEWPGKSDSSDNQDWSSGWAKNWEENTVRKDNRQVHPSPVSDNKTDIGDGSGFMSSAVNGAEIQTKSNQDQIDGMQSALNVFQEFLLFLRNTNLPVGSSETKTTNNDFDYNQMAKSWAKDVHA